ncbi:ROK family protein [Maledivibacter halophilus]|uniref:Glucokinase n=1 Tax=Maledivibacter halophilus TaxID=36842 RepID=A0A1T5KCX1_9FIRM|nr:ROK family protein [Maledivibacter halophilus]SKC61470.1 glucokinase [Maledivibacter halophilus]
MERYVLGVDLGGTKINASLVALDGKIEKSVVIPTMAHKGEKIVKGRINNAIEEILKTTSKEDILALGIGAPGPLDSKSGIIIKAPNLPFENFNITDSIKKKFSLPTYLDNDANAAAIGEYIFGSGKNTMNMGYITFSTGVGAGVIINGKIYRGSTGNALEIGHTTLDKNGPICGCGNRGCAEALCSGTAIAKKAIAALKGKVKTSLRKYKNITAKEVMREAKEGDKISIEIMEEIIEYIGICVGNMLVTFDPEKIILGGGLFSEKNYLLPKVKKVVQKRVFPKLVNSCSIEESYLGKNAGVIGAAAIAIMESDINEIGS